MTITEQVREALPRIRARMKKADNFDALVPAVLSCSIQLAGGDAEKGRQIASMSAPIAEVIEAKSWEVNMRTDPGDFVKDPQGARVYMYTGKDPMTHANQTYYPGASGVYYWSIIPEMRDGNKVYPNISGIIVAVKQNEIWWNQSMTARYKWTGADNNSCSWYPGQAGVHQWAVIDTE